jgi:hypothetical protein
MKEQVRFSGWDFHAETIAVAEQDFLRGCRF